MYSFRTFAQIRKRVRQKATLYSFLVVVLLFGLFLEAYMHNFNLVYITLFFVFAVAFSAGSFGMLNIGLLHLRYERCSRLFANGEGELYFGVESRYNESSWGIKLVCDGTTHPLPPLSPHTTTTVKVPLTPPKRGYSLIEACHLESLFPIATVRFVLPLENECRPLVYPEPLGKPLATFIEEHTSTIGEERDFEGLATYSGAEPLSRIHWASVAKGEGQVKKFEKIMIDEQLAFDFWQAGEGDEERLSQLTLWVLECERQDRPFTIDMPHQRLDSTKEEIDAILAILATY